MGRTFLDLVGKPYYCQNEWCLQNQKFISIAETGNKHILIAGGIGITPFLPQMDELAVEQSMSCTMLTVHLNMQLYLMS